MPLRLPLGRPVALKPPAHSVFAVMMNNNARDYALQAASRFTELISLHRD